MEQMTLFDSERPYKYIMDTSSILSQKPGETHTRLVYESQWERIEELFSNVCRNRAPTAWPVPYSYRSHL